MPITKNTAMAVNISALTYFSHFFRSKLIRLDCNYAHKYQFIKINLV